MHEENTNQDNNEVKYNDSADCGIGYLNRARTVSPNRGDHYEAVTVTGLRGRVDNPSYTYYDCKVIGKALDKYLLLKEAINSGDKKVVVRYKVSDSYPDSYMSKDGKTGEPVRRHVIKGKLLNITWASIDNQVVEFELDDDEKAPETDNSSDAPSNKPANDSHSLSPSYFDGVEMGEFMKLDRSDPEFTGKQAELKALGYNGLDNDGRSWHKPEATAA